jgi:hypothetical protein
VRLRKKNSNSKKAAEAGFTSDSKIIADAHNSIFYTFSLITNSE